jgi:hypothetical protein
MHTRSAALAAVLLTLLVAPLSADVISDTWTLPIQTTNWSTDAVLNQFDPGLGTLQSVLVRLTGDITGAIRYESLDAAPSTINAALNAVLTLSRPGGGALVIVMPVNTVDPDDVAAFDGSQDYGGPSGATHADLTAHASNSVTLTAPADLALFTGPGQLSLPIGAIGASYASGAGNLATIFTTNAGAEVYVEYTFSETPEPATLGLIGMGLIFLAQLRRRRG